MELLRTGTLCNWRKPQKDRLFTHWFFLQLILIVLFLSAPYEHHSMSSAGSGSGNLAPRSSEVSSISSAPAICQVSADKSIVECASFVELHADAGVNDLIWSTGARTHSITVYQSGEYWWEVINLEKNTVTNGTFSVGNSGFSSSYAYVPISGSTGAFGPITADGSYTISKNPSKAHSLFGSFSDHTSKTGDMLIINGASRPDVSIWKQNITVEPNTTYVFSVWGASATPGNPGKLAFTINGRQIGNINLSPGIGYWQNFTVYWSSGNNNTVASIAIDNKNTASDGNDFALDDIVFAPVCRKNFNVKLDPRPSKPVTSFTIQ